jgi:hypothetical protein
VANCSATSPRSSDDVELLFVRLKDAENESTICLLSFSRPEIDLNEALPSVANHPEQKLAAETLWFLFGKYVTVWQDGAWGNTRASSARMECCASRNRSQL